MKRLSRRHDAMGLISSSYEVMVRIFKMYPRSMEPMFWQSA